MPPGGSTSLFQFFETVQSFRSFLLDLWWFWLFWILFFVARSLWLAYIREHYQRSTKWVLLELKIPREVRKAPRAMEQVFMSMHTVRNSPNNIKEKWWDGEVTLWCSCEVVSFGGDVHFYLRVPERNRNIIEASLYSQYQDIQLVETDEDYINRLPGTYQELVEKGYELFGSELVLAKKDVYPIRTYLDFEAVEEERQLDPIATLLETMAKCGSQSQMWVQILARPRDNSWQKEGEKEVAALKEKTGRRQMFSPQFGEFVMIDRSPGEIELLKAVDRNIAKPGFDTLIRYAAITPKDVNLVNFTQRGILGSFNQYASEAFNKFRQNYGVLTRTNFWNWPHLFPRRRLRARKRRLYANYRRRKIYHEGLTSALLEARGFHFAISASTHAMVLNAEELATIFHLPTMMVMTGPMIRLNEARKIGPPMGLAIYGEEGESDLPSLQK